MQIAPRQRTVAWIPMACVLLALASGNRAVDAGLRLETSSMDGTFAPHVPYSTGDHPISVVFGDTNGDGIGDLAVANYWGPVSVSILLGRPDGTFGPKQDYPVPSAPWNVLFAKLHGTFTVDLVTREPNGQVSTWQGMGNGLFTNRTAIPVDQPRAIAAGDLDGNHREDLVIAPGTGNVVSVWLVNVDGTFQPPVDYAVAGPPYGLSVADVTRDGVRDLVVRNGNASIPHRISVLPGIGDGTFGPAIESGYAPGGGQLMLADLNGDAKLDIAEFPGVMVSRGHGDGTFDAGVILHPYFDGSGVAADFNRDARMDLAWANSSKVLVSMGRGDFTFDPPVEFTAGDTPWGITAGDVNRDGMPDLIVTNLWSFSVSVFMNELERATAVPDVDAIGSRTVAVTPNPTRGGATIAFTVDRPERIRLEIVDVQGRLVTRLADGFRTPGSHQLHWNGEGVSPGLYLVRYEDARTVSTGRLLRIQ